MAQYEIVLRATAPFGEMLSVLHYDIVSGPDPADWQEVSDEFRGQLSAFIAGNTINTVTYTGIDVREDVPGAVGINVPFSAGNLVGSSTDNDLAPQMAVLVRKLTDNLVNPAVGRIYHGGLSAAFLAAGGTWGAALLSDVGDFWEAMRIITIPSGTELQMVIKASDPTKPNTVPYNTVASVSARSNPVTQRRRRIGAGS